MSARGLTSHATESCPLAVEVECGLEVGGAGLTVDSVASALDRRVDGARTSLDNSLCSNTRSDEESV